MALAQASTYTAASPGGVADAPPPPWQPLAPVSWLPPLLGRNFLPPGCRPLPPLPPRTTHFHFLAAASLADASFTRSSTRCIEFCVHWAAGDSEQFVRRAHAQHHRGPRAPQHQQGVGQTNSWREGILLREPGRG